MRLVKPRVSSCAQLLKSSRMSWFQMGTSLSKGPRLTQRFSEDIDLALDVGGRGETTRDTLMKAIAQNAGPSTGH